MLNLRALLLVLAVGLLSGPAHAAKMSGVQVADTATVGGQKLVLNGLGMRLATFLKVKVYVAGLYLKAKSNDAGAIISKDAPRRLVLHFVRDVDADDLNDAWEEGFEKSDRKGTHKGAVKKLTGWMSDMKEGQSLAFSYAPGQGTSIEVQGKVRGTIPGAGFASSLFQIWLGGDPPNSELKKGLLGG